MHVRLANFAICLEPPKSQYSYLSMRNIISAAKIAQVEAIHPGYGFLAENAEFATLCQQHGLVFIGPSPETISRMGDKATAKETMRNSNVPVIPGSYGIINDLESAVNVAQKIGYPVIVKAVAGGGGRCLLIANDRHELAKAIQATHAEAKSAFGNGSVYIEKFFPYARHIEIQILADRYGNVVHFGERDCSMQRRYQKLIEESPSPAIGPSLRERMVKAAVSAARAVNYINAGTIEFLLDDRENFYFMEMNTRIQVEHSVTEMVTGIDLVEQQLKIAYGEQLPFSQNDIRFNGHAIECRINAEDPANGFMPSPGCINRIVFPSENGVRVDTHAFSGYTMPIHYDSLIAKIIVCEKTRKRAIQAMLQALNGSVIEGVSTTIPFHIKLLTNMAFREGHTHTKFVEEYLAAKEKGEFASKEE